MPTVGEMAEDVPMVGETADDVPTVGETDVESDGEVDLRDIEAMEVCDFHNLCLCSFWKDHLRFRTHHLLSPRRKSYPTLYRTGSLTLCRFSSATIAPLN